MLGKNNFEKPKRIMDDSPEFVKNREDKEMLMEGRHCHAFGELELSLINSTRRLMKILQSNPRASNEEIFSCKDEIMQIQKEMRESFAKLFKSDVFAWQALLEEFVSNPKLRAGLDSVRDKDGISFFAGLSDDELPIMLGVSIDIGVLPDDLLEKMIEFHVQTFIKEAELFKQQLPVLLAGFSVKAEQAINSGLLPITKEYLRKCITDTPVELADPAKNAKYGLLGHYMPTQKNIALVNNGELGNLEHSLTHEFMHVLSGQVFMLSTDNGKAKVTSLRNGVEFKDIRHDKSIFKWLNEAITETLAVDVGGNEDKDVYPEERENLQHLIKMGIPKELLVRAYFEHYDSNSSNRVPAWKELTAKINELLPNGMTDFLKTDADIAEVYARKDQEMRKKLDLKYSQ